MSELNLDFLLTHPKYHAYQIGQFIKGCDTVNDETSWNQDRQEYTQKFCLTHGVIICRCGWQKGWYLGTDSREMIVTKRKNRSYHQLYYARKKIKLNEDVNKILFKIQS